MTNLFQTWKYNLYNVFLTTTFSLRYVNFPEDHYITDLMRTLKHVIFTVYFLFTFCWQAEVNAQKASNNAQDSIRKLEETITEFQKQKLEDIKVSVTRMLICCTYIQVKLQFLTCSQCLSFFCDREFSQTLLQWRCSSMLKH